MSKTETAHDRSKLTHLLFHALFIFVIALTLRLIHLHQIRNIGFFDETLSDARVYQVRARGIANGDWLGPAGFVHAPLYAYFLAIFQKLSPENLYLPRLAQAFLGAGACVVIMLAGRRWFSPASGLLSGLLLAVYPPVIFFDGLIQKTSLAFFLAVCVLWTMTLFRDKPGPLRAAVLGLLLGLLILVQQSLLLLVPIVLFSLWTYSTPISRPRRLVAPAIGLLAIFGTMFPWAMRNRIVTGEFTWTTPNLGQNFAMGNHPHGSGTYLPFKRGRSSGEFEQIEWAKAAEKTVGRALSASEVSDHYLREALARIRADPAGWLRVLGRKCLMTLNAYEWPDTEDYYLYQSHSSLLRGLDTFFHFGVLAPLCAAGISMSWSRRRELWPLYAWLVASALGLIAFVVFARYRFAMLPVMMMFAAAGLLEVAGRVGGRSSRGVLTAAIVFIAAAIVANLPMGYGRRPSASGYVSHALALSYGGRLDEARREIDAALAIEPMNVEARLALGGVLRKQGRFEESLAAYAEAARADRTDGAALRGAAATLVDMDRLDEAARYGRQALELDDRDQLARSGLAAVLARQGRLEEAISMFKEALAGEPENPEAKVNMGNIYLNRGQIDNAERYYSDALQDDPNFADAIYNLAVLNFNRSRFDQALTYIDRYLKLRPSAGQAQVLRLVTLVKLDQLESALSEAKHLLVLDPKRDDLRQFLAELDRRNSSPATRSGTKD